MKIAVTLSVPKKIILEELAQKNIHLSKLIKHKDGTYTAKNAYFYRHGETPLKLAHRIAAAIPGAEVLEAYDDWKEWPKTSYFVVRFQITKFKESEVE